MRTRALVFSLLFASSGCASSYAARAPSTAVTVAGPPEARACTVVTSPLMTALRPEIVGNARLSREYLSCVLGNALRELRVPSGGFSGGELEEQARMLLTVAYYDAGFVDAHVRVTRPRTASERTRIEVTEGERVRVGALTVTETEGGAEVVPLGGRAAVNDLMHSRTGDWFSRSVMALDLMALRRLYRDAGYARVEVLPRVVVDRAAHTVSLAIEIQRGPAVTVERVEMHTGEGRARSDGAFLDAFHPRAGERFSESALEASRARIRASGLARRVDVSTEALPDRPDRLVVHVEMYE